MLMFNKSWWHYHDSGTDNLGLERETKESWILHTEDVVIQQYSFVKEELIYSSLLKQRFVI